MSLKEILEVKREDGENYIRSFIIRTINLLLLE